MWNVDGGKSKGRLSRKLRVWKKENRGTSICSGKLSEEAESDDGGEGETKAEGEEGGGGEEFGEEGGEGGREGRVSTSID